MKTKEVALKAKVWRVVRFFLAFNAEAIELDEKIRLALIGTAAEQDVTISFDEKEDFTQVPLLQLIVSEIEESIENLRVQLL